MDAKLQELCRQAHEDRIRVGMLDTDTKNRTLELAADALMAHEQEILEANAIDMERGRERNMPQGLLDRLKLDHDRLLGMADGLRQVAKLEDPIGEVMSMRKRPNGLIIGKVRVAIGVVGIIFEARPNVTSDAFGLCFKSGNCAILKGGSDAIHSNIAIVSAMKEALRRMNIPKGALSLIESTDRETTNAFMKMKDYVDLLIPRGGRGLIQSVVNNATIPVIETGTGNCHVYVDQFADQEMAVNIIKNAKTQRIGVCNACESIVVHRAIAKEFLPKLYAALKEYDVEMRGDSYAVECLGPDQPLVKDATEEDWGTEYLDYIMSVKIVDSLDEAVQYANEYAPEHLEINVEDPDALIPKLVNYGSLFIGQNTAEVFGDYASGTNHTLPTLRAARYTGGVWVGTFLKTCTHQSMTPEASARIAPLVSRMAHGEGLSGHAAAADARK